MSNYLRAKLIASFSVLAFKAALILLIASWSSSIVFLTVGMMVPLTWHNHTIWPYCMGPMGLVNEFQGTVKLTLRGQTSDGSVIFLVSVVRKALERDLAKVPPVLSDNTNGAGSL